MFRERGGSSMLARHAFNELVSFIAGWAILIEYVIVVALASISFAQYLSPIWGGFTHGIGQIAAVAAVIAGAGAVNAAGFIGLRQQGVLLLLAVGDIALQVAIMLAGLFVALHPELLTRLTSAGGRATFDAWSPRGRCSCRWSTRGSRRSP